MLVVTITKWRKKFSLVLMGIILVFCLGLGVNWLMSPQENTIIAPVEELKEDVLNQPVRVQGEPADSQEDNAGK